AGRIVVPWFAVGFVAVAGANSLHLLPGAWQAGLLALDNLLLATAMAALGLGTRWSAIRRAGGRPMVLATVLFGWLVAGGALVNGAIGDWWD
ncbi:MAG TPA: putative sulfate exporter family transporter, partial [Ottowia sp.]|nr:putative sulfate exporter family transporter [Ottowia sp.]